MAPYGSCLARNLFCYFFVRNLLKIAPLDNQIIRVAFNVFEGFFITAISCSSAAISALMPFSSASSISATPPLACRQASRQACTCSTKRPLLRQYSAISTSLLVAVSNTIRNLSWVLQHSASCSPPGTAIPLVLACFLHRCRVASDNPVSLDIWLVD